MQWNTREHWFWGLALPGRVPILFILVGTLLTFTSSIWIVFTGLCLMVVGLAALSDIFFHWQAFLLAFPPGGGVLLERNGRRLIVERRIGLTMVGNITYEQTLIGRFFDYGTLMVGALGGPYRWENLGGFRTLRRIIDSQGGWMPPTRNPLAAALGHGARSALQTLRDLLASFTRILLGLSQEVRTVSRYLTTPSYRRFLEFAESILFLQNTHRFEGSSLESYFTKEEISLYQRILHSRRLLVSNQQGHILRHKRVRTYQDIRRQVPPSWFRKAIRAG